MKNRNLLSRLASIRPSVLVVPFILFSHPSVFDTMPGNAPGSSEKFDVPMDGISGDSTGEQMVTDAEPVALEVVTGEFRRVRGDLFIEVSDASGEELTGGIHPVTGKTITVQFDSLVPGTVAVRLFHDENSNGKLDTNLFGIPSEGYGFSNNPRSRFGEPPLKDRVFELHADTTIHIELIYW